MYIVFIFRRIFAWDSFCGRLFVLLIFLHKVCIVYIYIYIEDWNHVSIPSKCILNTFPTDQLKKGILKQSPPGLQRELEWSTSRSTSPCGSIQVPLPTKGFTVSGEDWYIYIYTLDLSPHPEFQCQMKVCRDSLLKIWFSGGDCWGEKIQHIKLICKLTKKNEIILRWGLIFWWD